MEFVHNLDWQNSMMLGAYTLATAATFCTLMAIRAWLRKPKD